MLHPLDADIQLREKNFIPVSCIHNFDNDELLGRVL